VTAANAATSDVVLVTDGNYNSGSTIAVNDSKNRVYLSKNITVQSVNGAGSTTITGASDGGGYGVNAIRSVYMTAGTLDGFTITGGYTQIGTSQGDDDCGGGIWISDGEVTNCIITANNADSRGGGIWMNGGGTISNSTISNNNGDCEYGGGLNLQGGGTVSACIIENNECDSRGGGAFIRSGGEIINSLIRNNESTGSSGGGVDLYGTGGYLINSTVVANTSSGNGGGISVSSGSPTVQNCIAWGNTGGTGEDIFPGLGIFANCCASDGLTGGVACITSDPLFVNAAGDDYRISASSPCADLGNNTYCDETYGIRGSGFARKLNKTTGAAGTIDMGAYEYNVNIAYYVDADATAGNNDGTSWADAYTSLQSALSAASSGDNIWVAAGTYYPSVQVGGTGDRYQSFQMKNGVTIYGGFAGTETATSQRTDYAVGGTNECILSGDIGTLGVNTDNCFHVFNHPYGTNLDATAILDGFTISGGYADASSPEYFGGGMYNHTSSPTINQCTFTNNYASNKGGGLYSTYSSEAITNCIFSGNTANYGGGVYISVSSSCSFTNSVFYNNATVYSGGAIYCADYSELSLINCTVSGNNAVDLGGGICVVGDDFDPYSHSYKNCLIWGNLANTHNEISFYGVDATISYCDIAGCGGSGAGWSLSGGTDGGNNIDSNPLFVDAAGDDYRIYGVSPCADAGNDAANSESYDVRGNGYDRKLNKTSGAVGTIDMGAYEFKFGSDPYRLGPIYVDADATGSNDGSSWTDAYTSLQSALTDAVASSDDNIWVAAGTYYPSVEVGGTGDRYQTFQMKNGVAIYGGFAGTETAASQRSDFGVGGTNETILSGDIGTQDVNTDNCYHIFYHPNGTGLDATAVLDGFTVSKGYADASSGDYQYGGGMFNYASSPTINNCTFSNNACRTFGGGMYNYSGASPTISNCSFISNEVIDGDAGGMYNNNSSPTITNCVFTSNEASMGSGAINNTTNSSPNISNCTFTGNVCGFNGGGGIGNYSSSPSITNCLFYNNMMFYSGGGAYGGGGIRNVSSSPAITNCTFYNNSSNTSGGAMANYSSSAPTIKNCILWGNEATPEGNEVYNSSSTPVFSYNDIAGSGGSSSWDTGLGTDDGNNINSNPLFVDEVNGDYRICGYSPCADAGSDAANSESYDIRGSGYERKLDKTTGATGTIDMGAYEYKTGTDPLYAEIYWEGTSTSDWSTTGNCSGYYLPFYVNNVTIPDLANDPVLAYNATATCHDLTVESGDLLTIQSSADGTGSLIVEGSSNGNIKAERYVGSQYWHYVSSPVAGQEISTTWMSTNNIANTPPHQFFRWDEATNYWIIYGDALFSDTEFGAAKGYAVTVAPSGDLHFTGTVRTSAVNYAATYTADQGKGFNLIGNPFSSTIAINESAQADDNFLADNTGILADDYQAVYIWQETGGYTYGDNDYSVVCNTGFTGEGSSSILGQNYIQPGQGFMVRVIQAGNIVFNTDIRKHGSADFYKSKESWPGVELRIKGNELSNTTIIAFHENMTNSLDPSYDVVKFKGNPNLALYTQLVANTGKDYAVQALLDQNIEDYEIPIGVDVTGSGVFEFSVYQEMLNNYNIVLEDRQENTFTNLRWDTYFATISESGTGRFYLHFRDATAIGEITPETIISFRYLDGKILISNPDLENGIISLVNISGQVLVKAKLNGDEFQLMPVNQPVGIYIINLQTVKTTFGQKIFIQP